MTQPPSAGYDAPISREQDDVLGRWPFAEEIFSLVADSPTDVSMRIAVYGDWGVGKTSVLHLIEARCREAGIPVINFNPWRARSSQALWETFFSDLSSVASRIDQNAAGKIVSKVRIQKAIAVARDAADLAKDKAKLIGRALDWLEERRKYSEKDLAPLLQRIQGRRLVVLVDDLDRADAQLVPQVLQALKEILDLPGLAFVLAFDRARVATTLAAQNPGFGDGAGFLDKIVEFPRWIPEALPSDLATLGEKDLLAFAPFVPVAALRDVVDYLPKNPRSLRLMIRGLARLKRVAARYHPDELSWTTFLILETFRVHWPLPAQQLFAPARTDNELPSYIRFLAGRASAEETAKKYTEAARRVGVPEADAPAAARLLEAAASHAGFNGLLSCATLLERAPAVTGLEFEKFFDTWRQSPDATTIEVLITDHSSKFRHRKTDIVKSLFALAIDRREQELILSIDSAKADDAASHTLLAQKATEFLRQLAVDGNAFGSFPPMLDTKTDFKKLLISVLKWNQFDDTAERKHLHSIGHQTVDKIVSTIPDPAAVFHAIDNVLMPDWRGLPIAKELRAKARLRLAETVFSAISQPGMLQSILVDSNKIEERALFLDANGPLWQGLLRSKMLECFREPTEPLHQGAVFALLNDQVRRDLNDSEIIDALWFAATAHPLNPRFAGSLSRVIPQLETVVNRKLETPKSWSIFATKLNEPE